ncbi:MAG: hypothetical protein ACRD2I_05770, partial [Vicinamibacterales bacterium]
AVPVTIAVAWLGWHPEMWWDTAGRYHVYDPRHLTSLPGLRSVLDYRSVQEGVSVYWDYFNPAYLFFSGGSNLSMSTRRAGVYLLPMSALLACGVYDCWRRRSAVISRVLLAGLLVAPLPATLIGERYAIQRELVALPFVALIATFGAALLLRHPARTARLAAMLLLLAMPAQFAVFWQDYFNGYRVRSAFSFDPVNFRGVAEYLIANTAPGQAPRIYLSADLDDVAARWRFYLIKQERQDLLPRSSLFTPTAFAIGEIPPASFLVLYANDPAVPTLVGPTTCSVAAYINDVTGRRSAVILRRVDDPQPDHRAASR